MDINGNARGVRVGTKEATPTPQVEPAPHGSLVQRPSGVFPPRQNSGINAILDTDMEANDDSASLILTKSGAGQIRSSYEKSTASSPRPPSSSRQGQGQAPFGLANIMQHRLRQAAQGGGNSSTVLSKAFFDSVRDQVQFMKQAEANESMSSYFSQESGPLSLSSAPSTIFSTGELQKISRVAVPPCASSKFCIDELSQNSRATLGSCASSKFSIGGVPNCSTVTVPSCVSSKFSMENLQKTSKETLPTSSSSKFRVGGAQKLSTENVAPTAARKLSVEELRKSSKLTIPKSSSQKVPIQELQRSSTLTIPCRRNSQSNQVSRRRSSSRDIQGVVIKRDESGASLNINLTLKLSHFDESSVPGIGSKKGSQSFVSNVETEAVVGPLPQQSATSNIEEIGQVSNQSHHPSLMDVQAAIEDGVQPENSGDWEPSCVTSTFSEELLALDEKREPIEGFSTTDVLYNTIMSVTSSNTVLGAHQRVPSAKVEKLSSAQVSNNATEFLSTENVTPSLATDENGNVIDPEDGTPLSQTESRAYVLEGIIKALDMLETTGDSIGSAAASTFSLIANIVPTDGCEFDEETMNASESDIPIQLMRLLGVPKTTRHNIYSEACGEVEVLQDLGTGTYDVLTTLLKWVCGGKAGREDFKATTRTLCSVLTEVDLDSEVWKGVSSEVGEIAETVTDMAEDIIEDGVDTAEALGNSFVKLLNQAANSTLNVDVDEAKVCAIGSQERIEILKNPTPNEDEERDKALELFFENIIEEDKLEENVIAENEMDKAAEPGHQLVDVNNNLVVECSSSQHFVPCLGELRHEADCGDKLDFADIPQEFANLFATDVDENNNPYSFGKLLDVKESASLIYEPAYCSKHAHIEQGSLSSVKFERTALSSLPNLENFFSKRTLNASTFKTAKDQNCTIVNSVDDLNSVVPTIASSSAHLLSKMPRAPPNSDATFDAADSEHEDKAIQDMTTVSKLVKELYEGMNVPTLPPSQTTPKELDEPSSLATAPSPTLATTRPLTPTPILLPLLTPTIASPSTPTPAPPSRPSPTAVGSLSTPTPVPNRTVAPKSRPIPVPSKIAPPSTPTAAPPSTPTPAPSRTLATRSTPSPNIAPPPTPASEPLPTLAPSSTPTPTPQPQPTPKPELVVSSTQTPNPLPRVKSKLELLPSRIPVPKQQVAPMKRSPTFVLDKSTRESKNSDTETEHSLVPDNSGTLPKMAETKQRSGNKELKLEPSGSSTSVYSVSGDSVRSRPCTPCSRSFLKPTMSSAAKTQSKRSATRRPVSSAASSRISSNTSLNLLQKTSASSMESNPNWLMEDNECAEHGQETDATNNQERPQTPQTSYQKIFQQKNISIAKQLTSKRFRF